MTEQKSSREDSNLAHGCHHFWCRGRSPDRSDSRAQDEITHNVSGKGQVLHLCCGAGIEYPLNGMCDEVSVHSVEENPDYLRLARMGNEGGLNTYEQANPLLWKPKSADETYDAIVLLNALHRFKPIDQRSLIRNLSRFIKPKGFLFISDFYIPELEDNARESKAIMELDFAYMKSYLHNLEFEDFNSSKSLEYLLSTIEEDLQGKTFKTSLKKQRKLFGKYFRTVEQHSYWPKYRKFSEDMGSGVYAHILRDPKT